MCVHEANRAIDGLDLRDDGIRYATRNDDLRVWILFPYALYLMQRRVVLLHRADVDDVGLRRRNAAPRVRDVLAASLEKPRHELRLAKIRRAALCGDCDFWHGEGRK